METDLAKNNAGLLQGLVNSGEASGTTQYGIESKKVSHDLKLDAANLLTAIRDHEPLADEEDLFWIESAIAVLDRLMARQEFKDQRPAGAQLDFTKCIHLSYAGMVCPLKQIGMTCGPNCGAASLPPGGS